MSPPAQAAATALLVFACAQLAPAPAWADPEPLPVPTPEPVALQQTPERPLHNVTYRARIDGIARGALVTYKINDTQVQSASPTMLPGRVFEAQTVLSDANLAGMQVSVQWPYSANLHCEIIVDDATVAQADQFIRPRLTHADDDPDYGKLFCGAPLISAAGAGNVVATAVEPPAPATPAG